MIKISLSGFCLFLFLWLFSSVLLNGQERIVQYDVDIKVHKNRSLDITEYIKVNAEGFHIRRGITRDLPTKRILGSHGRQTVFYDIKNIEKDGKEVPFKKEDIQEGIILYIGDPNAQLNTGLHDYKIEYTVKNQIAFFEEYEELYWNAIGTNNMFAIDNANITIHFPEQSTIEETHIYTGRYGEQREQVGVQTDHNTVELQSIESLLPYEGVTASVILSSGSFDKPSFFQRRFTITLLLMSLGILLAYFYTTWNRYGRDPKIDDVGPVYEPPDDLSPAACGYILSGYNQNRLAVASIVDLMQKGHLDIEYLEGRGILKSGGGFTIKKGRPSGIQYDEQRQLFNTLFRRKATQTLNGTYNADLAPAFKKHNASLAKQLRAFLDEGNNTKFLFLPIVWVIATTILLVVSYTYEPYTEIAKLPILILYPIFSLILFFIYGWLIRQPTREKLILKAKIKRLKDYLSWTEQDFVEGYDMDMRDIEHFESLLPYAYALGVADQWQSSFESVIKETLEGRSNYWFYSTPYFYNHFPRTMTSSSTPPPSSGGSGGGFSGGGGGGFSGGGGGGGGVGGW